MLLKTIVFHSNKSLFRKYYMSCDIPAIPIPIACYFENKFKFWNSYYINIKIETREVDSENVLNNVKIIS